MTLRAYFAALGFSVCLFSAARDALAEQDPRSDEILKESLGLALQGTLLSRSEAKRLELDLNNKPEDTEARLRLLGYAFANRFKHPEARKLHRSLVLWMIDNSPDAKILSTPYGRLNIILDAVTYQKAKGKWLRELKEHQDNADVLANSANFFLLFDKRLAEKSLVRLRSLQPDNFKWPSRLGHLYYMLLCGTSTASERSLLARKSLSLFETAFELAPENEKPALLPNLAETAYETGFLTKARHYADLMLKTPASNWNHANNIHHGHVILGRLALRSGAFEKAEEHLLLAAEVEGSPQLKSFGPNMRLALELLKMKRRRVVLKYLELCSKFWKNGEAKLLNWMKTVNSDAIPDFGANLYY